MFTTKLSGFLVAALLSLLTAGAIIPAFAAAADDLLVFNTTVPANDLTGSLAAQVLFAQSQIIPARSREGDNQPHLIGDRKCLLLVRPLKKDPASPLQVVGLDGNGRTLGTVLADSPDKLPKTAYFLDGLPEGKIDFKPLNSRVSVIRDKDELRRLSDADAVLLVDRLRQHGVVEIQTADGQWVRDIHLPANAGLTGRIVRVRSNAGYSSTLHYSGRTSAISRGQMLELKCFGDHWLHESDLANQGLTYATDAWSCVLPADWIAPGLKLQFRQNGLTGELSSIRVGAPTQLLLHTIDIGMLVPPRNRFEFAGDPSAHREYFQTVPTSRLIVSQYAPLYLREIVLPNGTALAEQDPGKGDWHNGQLRQRIGKELISHGIDNANYGIHSTAGEGEDSHPYVAAQMVAHNSSGMYSNGIVVHGGSGGGGIVTLDNTLGNEFSHEVGHNYGLGHYVGGFRGSVHRSADQINSTWGWDADKNRFLPNFEPIPSGKDTCIEDQCQSPFAGRSFGLDAMAGGAPLSDFNRFTLYTPNSAAVIQKFLESKAVFDAQSPTGFRKWNSETGEMEPFRHRIEIASQIAAPVNQLSEQSLAKLLAEYDIVNISMEDGTWTKNVQLPPAAPANRGRVVTIDQAATYESLLSLNGRQVKMPRGFRKSFTSDGTIWKEGQADNQWMERKPQNFGVPVTTLVGYYDPQGQLNGYIYPPLHGAWGFTYADDRDRTTDEDCQLLVETRSGPLRFRLSGKRFMANVMNKFHINIPESSQPQNVRLICRGKVVDTKPITPPPETLRVTQTPRR
ncbi:MAG: M66 family metalloprotease [Planctomycetaceae bacterium]